MQSLKIYTDGGCSGNPGPGAWAYIILNEQEKITGSGNEKLTTNNKMELIAVISALESINTRQDLKNNHIEIFTDSQYVKNGITTWIHSWIKNGWQTAKKEPVKNKEYWMRLKENSDLLHIKWNWILGHAGNTFNEECDRLVQKEIKSIR